jgi:hypothetical protein
VSDGSRSSAGDGGACGPHVPRAVAPPSRTIVYTIGHSNHSIERFVSLLSLHGVTAVADVRSVPFSRRNPQFNRRPLAAALGKAGIACAFLGDELGARPDDPACCTDGQVDFRLLAARDEFARGIERVLEGARKYTVALMCAEREPLDCHRTILVCRRLAARGVAVRHILADGSVEEHGDTEARLVRAAGLERDLLGGGRTDAQLVEEAYDRRGREIAWSADRRDRAGVGGR